MQLALRRHLLASTVLIGTSMLGTAAYAQTQTADATPADNEGTIVVTGSLISNPNLERSTPVNVTTSEEVELRQTNVAEQLLREIPGVVPSIGSAVNNGNGGASYVDLRGLGSFRNIVLLDGNRIAPSGLVGRVDLNNIPLALIERTEVLTGGASTTYGADAVSGVVNFITKQNFSGLEMQASEQITERGDGNVFRVDTTIGANFDDGRGNAVFSIGYQEADPVYQGARSFSRFNVDSFTGGASGSGTTVPSRFTGTRPIDPATGQPSVNPATANGGVRQLNPTTGQAVTTFQLFNFNPYNIFQTPFKRYNMFGQARYEVSDGLEVYTRGLFSKNTVKTIIAPSGVFNSSVTINLNNPFLPDALRNQFCAFDTDTGPGYTPRFTPTQCLAAKTATGPSDPNYRTVTTNLGRRTPEVGPRISDFRTQIFDYRLGVRGNITDSINWDLNGSYGESENTQTLQGYVLTSRVRQALLVNGTLANPVCNDTSNGCVPLNVFGQLGTITPAQVPFITGESTTTTRTSLAQARALVSGDFGATLPWAEDAINFAVGGEYRQYKASQRSDSLAKTAGELGGAGGAAPDITGGFDVYEAYGELVAPLVQDKPFFQALTLEAGIRYSHYTIDAPNRPKFNTTTWKVQGNWEIVDAIKLRGGYSRAVRAPNISELFSPQNTGLTNLATDPCAGAAPVANATLRAVCLAQGAPVGTIGSILNPTAGQANITTGGNLNLKPEKSNSYTIGAVLQPGFLPGFAASIDYYNIKISGAITTPTPGDLISACFGSLSAASATDPACTSIRRNPATGGLDGDPATTRGLFGALSNAGRLKTDGIDLTMNYNTDLGFAKLALSFAGNWTRSSDFAAAGAGTFSRKCVGLFSVNCSSQSGSIQPEFSWTQRTTLTVENVDLSLLWRHISSQRFEGNEADFVARGFAADGSDRFLYQGPVTGTVVGESFNYGTRNFNFIESYDYFDIATRIGVGDNLTFTVTVSNLFDKKPPIVGATAGSTSYNSGNTYPSTYDALGRTFKVGARLRF